jgi:hypothetical protein
MQCPLQCICSDTTRAFIVCACAAGCVCVHAELSTQQYHACTLRVIVKRSCEGAPTIQRPLLGVAHAVHMAPDWLAPSPIGCAYVRRWLRLPRVASVCTCVRACTCMRGRACADEISCTHTPDGTLHIGWSLPSHIRCESKGACRRPPRLPQSHLCFSRTDWTSCDQLACSSVQGQVSVHGRPSDAIVQHSGH